MLSPRERDESGARRNTQGRAWQDRRLQVHQRWWVADRSHDTDTQTHSAPVVRDQKTFWLIFLNDMLAKKLLRLTIIIVVLRPILYKFNDPGKLHCSAHFTLHQPRSPNTAVIADCHVEGPRTQWDFYSSPQQGKWQEVVELQRCLQIWSIQAFHCRSLKAKPRTQVSRWNQHLSVLTQWHSALKLQLHVCMFYASAGVQV